MTEPTRSAQTLEVEDIDRRHRHEGWLGLVLAAVGVIVWAFALGFFD